jgi:hypothetical protein
LALSEGCQWGSGRSARSTKVGVQRFFRFGFVSHPPWGGVLRLYDWRNLTSNYALGRLCKGYVVYPWPFTLVVKIESVKPRLERDHDLWVKCTNSTEC